MLTTNTNIKVNPLLTQRSRSGTQFLSIQAAVRQTRIYPY